MCFKFFLNYLSVFSVQCLVKSVQDVLFCLDALCRPAVWLPVCLALRLMDWTVTSIRNRLGTYSAPSRTERRADRTEGRAVTWTHLIRFVLCEFKCKIDKVLPEEIHLVLSELNLTIDEVIQVWAWQEVVVASHLTLTGHLRSVQWKPPYMTTEEKEEERRGGADHINLISSC